MTHPLHELSDLEMMVIELFCAREEITVDYFLDEFYDHDVFTSDFLQTHLASLL